jgi:TonB family protein
MWSSLGIAATVEAALIGLILAWLIFHEVTQPYQSLPIEILSETKPVEAVKPETPKPPTPKIEPRVVKTQPQIQPPTPQPTPAVVTPTETPVASTPTAFTQPAPPPPAPSEPKNIGPTDEYIARVKAAVQTAFYYPMAAIEMGLHGRVRVGFNLKGTLVSEPHIVSSSGLGIIDRAALQAVQKANYPTPSAEIRDRSIAYEVWIEFKP